MEKARVSALYGVRAMSQDPSWAAYYTLPSTNHGRVDLFDVENAIAVASHASMAAGHNDSSEGVAEGVQQVLLIRDIFGNPFRPVAFDPVWNTSTVVALAQGMYAERDFSAMPILADALQDAGCDNDDVLNHCRGPGPHVRGCWVVDAILSKS